jgi:hypothetical protein
VDAPGEQGRFRQDLVSCLFLADSEICYVWHLFVDMSRSSSARYLVHYVAVIDQALVHTPCSCRCQPLVSAFQVNSLRLLSKHVSCCLYSYYRYAQYELNLGV